MKLSSFTPQRAWVFEAGGVKRRGCLVDVLLSQYVALAAPKGTATSDASEDPLARDQDGNERTDHLSLIAAHSVIQKLGCKDFILQHLHSKVQRLQPRHHDLPPFLPVALPFPNFGAAGTSFFHGGAHA